MKFQLPIKLLTNEIRVLLSADELNDSTKITAEKFSQLCEKLINKLDQCFDASSAKELLCLLRKEILSWIHLR